MIWFIARRAFRGGRSYRQTPPKPAPRFTRKPSRGVQHAVLIVRCLLALPVIWFGAYLLTHIHH